MLAAPQQLARTQAAVQRKVTVTRLSFAASLVCAKVLLDYAYAAVVAPAYGYMGLALRPDTLKYIESYAMLFALVPLLPTRPSRPSHLLVIVLLLVSVLPALSIYGLSGASRTAMWLMWFAYLTTLVVSRGRSPRFAFLSLSSKATILGLAVIAAATLFLMLRRGALDIFNLNILRVYEFRDVANARFSGVLAYLVLWTTKVVNPALIVLTLHYRRWLATLALSSFQVLLFGMTSHRAVLLYPAIVIGTYFLTRHRRGLTLVGWSVSGLVAASVGAFLLLGDPILLSLFVRRAFFIPALLHFSYYDFFSERGPVYFGNSFLSGIVYYPFQKPPQEMIGDFVFTGDPGAWANTGFLSAGYMQLGPAGMLIYAGIAGLLLKLTDGLAGVRLPTALVASIVIVPYLILFTTSDLPTTLLSHGLALSLIVAWLLAVPHDGERSGGVKASLKSNR